MRKLIRTTLLKLKMKTGIGFCQPTRSFLLMSLLLISTAGSAADYYWVRGTGNWSDIANHWATSSGGSSFHGQVPGSADDVFFDVNSFTATGQVVTIDQTIVFFHNMDWTGAAFHPELSAPSITLELNIFGSLTLIPAMNFNTKGSWVFGSNLPGNTIRSAGQIFQNQVQFNGGGGAWSLMDELNLNGTAVATNTGFITLVKGSFNTNSQDVICLGFNSSNTNTRALIMDNSLITLNGGSPNSNALIVWNTTTVTNFTVSATGSDIFVTNTSRPSFRSGAKTFNNLTFSNPAGSKTSIVGTGTAFNGNVIFAGDGTVSGPCVFNGNLSFNSIASIGGANICNGLTTLSGNSIITSSNTFNGILNLSSGKTYTITAATTQTIGASGTLIASGTCTSFINMESSVNGVLCNINKLNGDLNIDQVVLQDINATVAPGFSANAINSVDAGNNPGWNFPPALGADMFWIGGSGLWNDPTHWSLSSGGIAGTCIPGPGNDVFFNNGSGFTVLSKTVTLNINIANCKSMNWTGASFSPILATTSSGNQLKVFGSLTLISAMSITGSGILSFESRTAGKTITTAGRSLAKSIVFNGVGGYWTLADALTTTSSITLNSGILNTNNQLVNAAGLISSNSNLRTLILGSSVLTLSGGGSSPLWTISGINFSFDCGISTLRFTHPSNFLMTSTGNFTYHNINFESSTATVTMTGNSTINGNVTFAGNGVITGSNTFNANLTFSAGKSYTLTTGQTQTISATGTVNANGTCAAYINIESDINGSQSTINIVNNNLNVDNGIIQDIRVILSPGFSANATNKSTDAGNNTGWNFSANTGAILYWIGGAGNWTDPSHWSLSSGGVAGSCIPRPFDDVYFDANSFTSAGQTVTVNTVEAYCRNMDWTGAGFIPTLTTSASANLLRVFGSFTLINGMNITSNGGLYFESRTTGNTITSAGKALPFYIVFNGLGGEWTLLDDFTNTNSTPLVLKFGTWNTNSQPVACFRFNSSITNFRTLNLGSTIFTVNGPGTGTGSAWNTSIFTNFTLNAGTSTIRFTNPLDAAMAGGGKTYNSVIFENSNATNTIGSNNTFNGNIIFKGIGILASNGVYNGNVSFSGDASITGSNTFNGKLKFSQGKTYTLTSNQTQTFGNNGSLNAIGTPCFPIAILSSINGSVATLTKASGEICADYLHIVDCRTTGVASFKAGIHSDNATPATNTGWQFIECSTPVVPPVIITDGNTVFCGSTTLSTRPAASYLWSTGQTTQSIIVSNSGTYSVYIINFSGCSESGSITITINPNPTCSIAGPSSVCSGALLTYAAPAGMSTYLWTVSGNASIAGSGTSPTVNINATGSSAGGSYTVELMVSNAFGCTSTCTSLVTINPAPVITCPGNQSATAITGSCNAVVTYSSSSAGTPAPAVSYTFTGATIGNGNGDGSGSAFNVGITTVTLTATNTCGTVSCTFTVMVTDSQLPTVLSQNITVSLSGGTAHITPSEVNNGSSDNCGIASMSVSPDHFDCTNAGNNTVTFTVTDVNGNVNTGTAIVTVKDVTAPTVITQNISVNLNSAGVATITAADVNNGSNDDCGIASKTVSPNSFSCSTIGPNTVTLTVTDVNGNVNTGTAIVTVKDVNAPTVVTQNISVNLNSAGVATITAADVNNGSGDACGIVSMTVSPNSFSCSTIGPNTVTLTMTDVNGNVNSGTALVTINDITPPVALCKNISVTLVNGTASIFPSDVNNGSYDACGIQSLTLSKTSFSSADIGANTVTLTVMDNNNLVSTCQSTVTVVGVTQPCTISVTPSTTIYTGGDPKKIYLGYGPQSVILTATGIGAGSFTYSWNGAYLSGSGATRLFTPTAAGTYNIVCTTTNAFGYQSTCTVTLCVLDIRSGGSGNSQKVYLCHLPSGNQNNPQTLEISVNAVAGHLTNHPGDKLGSCNQTCEVGQSIKARKVAEEKSMTSFEEMYLIVYPSPNNGKFVIDISTKEKGDLKLVVIDMMGRIVYRQNQKISGPENIPVNLEDEPQGLYLVKVEMNGQVQVKHVMLLKK